jgi:hypothetical protein
MNTLRRDDPDARFPPLAGLNPWQNACGRQTEQDGSGITPGAEIAIIWPQQLRRGWGNAYNVSFCSGLEPMPSSISHSLI